MTTERKVFTEVNGNGEQVKISKIEMYNRLLKIPDIAESPLYTDFIKYQIELLQRKSSAKATTNQNPEKIAMAEKLYELLLKSNAETTIKEILQTEEFSVSKGFSSQKIAPLLKYLIDNEKVEKIVVKRVNYYKAVAVVE